MKLFIAGTGTGVGKTFTSCAIVKATGWRAVKPVISGFGTGDCDTTQLIEAMGKGTIDDVSPWRYAAPISPDMAAAREGSTVPYDDIVAWSRTQDALIEGVGGIMVPLTARHTTLDWMKVLQRPVVLVTGSYLGSLSHTLTALAALRTAKLDVTALIINESCDAAVPLPEMKSSLANHTDVKIVAQPRVASYREASEIHQLARTWI